jgi:hypothetical protein
VIGLLGHKLLGFVFLLLLLLCVCVCCLMLEKDGKRLEIFFRSESGGN